MFHLGEGGVHVERQCRTCGTVLRHVLIAWKIAVHADRLHAWQIIGVIFCGADGCCGVNGTKAIPIREPITGGVSHPTLIQCDQKDSVQQNWCHSWSRCIGTELLRGLTRASQEH